MNTTNPRAVQARSQRKLLVLVVAPSLLVAAGMFALYFVAMPLLPVLHTYYFPQSTATYATYRVAILGHILFGSVALAIGPINLYNALRRKHRRVPRRLGGSYAVAVSLSATFALFMSFHAYAGTIPGGRLLVTSGLFTLGCVWLATLYAAVRAIAVDRDVDRHAFWMIINISAAYSAVLFRVLNGVIVAVDRFDLLYPLLGWAGWVPSVAVGVLLARRHARRSQQRRESVARAARPAVAAASGTVR